MLFYQLIIFFLFGPIKRIEILESNKGFFIDICTETEGTKTVSAILVLLLLVLLGLTESSFKIIDVRLEKISISGVPLYLQIF